jgi:hypothetical protein
MAQLYALYAVQELRRGLAVDGTEIDANSRLVFRGWMEERVFATRDTVYMRVVSNPVELFNGREGAWKV